MTFKGDWLIVNGESGTSNTPKPTCIEAAKKVYWLFFEREGVKDI